ncbi:MAG: thiamine pyrophosphate-binding protein [Pseudomonadota bacterium]
MPTGGELIVDCLKAQGVDRVFCVPGESYLDVLDALYESGIEAVGARHEGGAAMMAEADGKLTGRPGVALVTRGPGATNAAAGVHVAKQDSTPMVLLVGQIGRAMRGREAFQEVDYRQTFRDLAKWVEEIDQAARIPEVMSHAWHVAMAGRPGPVVLSLPEDMLREGAQSAAGVVAAGPRVEPIESAPSPAQMARLQNLLDQAERPMMVLGGSRWTALARSQTMHFAARFDIPTAVSFRRQTLFDPEHPAYAGDAGLGANPALVERMKRADLLILLGARFSENPSQDFTVLGIPKPQQTLVHVHPGPEEIGRIYTPDLGIVAAPAAFLEAAATLTPARAPSGQAEAAHRSYLDWTAQPERAPGDSAGGVDMGAVIAHLRDSAREDQALREAVLCNGAGNYAIWLHRFHRYRVYGTQLAPTSGSMGYGLPAAIAAKRRLPDREVVAFAGDGCFQMTGMEFGTAAQLGLGVLVIVVDNGSYATIRMHQEKRFPGRVSATALENPDFAALARAYGAFGETVRETSGFADAFARARAHIRAAGGPALLHLLTDVEALTPTLRLSAL